MLFQSDRKLEADDRIRDEKQDCFGSERFLVANSCGADIFEIEDIVRDVVRGDGNTLRAAMRRFKFENVFCSKN